MTSSTSPAAARGASFVYWGLALFHLLPVWAAPWYVSLDGPCHLYNARLLLDLFRGDPFTSAFFTVNPFPEPYWSGQLLMASAFTVLPARWVEKLVFTLIVLGTAAAFRQLVRILAPDRPWMACLGMPFLLHYGVAMGFINFCLSLPLGLLAIRWVLLDLRAPRRPWQPLLLFTLLYFTHPSTFLVAVGISAACIAMIGFRGGAVIARRSLLHLAMGAAPGCALLLAYVIHHPTARATTTQVPMPTLLRWLGEGRCFNALGVPGELLTSSICAIALLLLAVGCIIQNTRRKEMTTWSLLTAAALGAYLLVPDVMAGGSSASPRILLFLFLVMVLWIAATPLPRWWAAAGLTVLVLADGAHTVIQTRSAITLSRAVEEVVSLAPALDDASVLLPLNHSDNWMHSNISNYLGVQGPRVVVLDNFVATAPFSPVRWREAMLPYEAIGDFAHSDRPCLRIAAYGRNSGRPVDQALRWMQPPGDSCSVDATRQLDLLLPERSRSNNGNAELRSRHRP